MKVFSISLVSSMKHWSRKPLQFLFLIIGLSLATALWSSIQLLNSQAQISYENAVKILVTSETEIIVPKNDLLIPFESFAKLRRAGWLITPILEGKISGKGSLTILGIEPLTMYESNNYLTEVFFNSKSFKDLIFKKNLGFASQETIKDLEKLALGLDISINDKLLPNVLITDISIAENILDKKGGITRFELTGPAPDNKEILLKLGLRFIDSNSQGDLEQLTKSFHLNLTAFGLLGFIVGLFIVYSTLNLAFEQRKGTYRTLRSIGVSIRIIYASILIEIFLLALVGGIIGIFLGHWLASFLLRDVASTLNYIYGANLGDQLLLSIEEILIALFMPFLGTLLISINFILRLYQMFPNNLNCLILWEKLSRKKTSLNLSFAILLIALIFILARSSLTLLQSFSIIGLVIITASCLLPIVLRAILLLILSSISTKMPLVKWFLSDSYQQVNRTALSLTALMLAVAVTIGVDSMVKSFKETFNIWLENRLITEIYVRTQDETLASRLISELKNEEMIKNIYPMINIKSRFKDQPITIVGFEPAEVYIKNWPLLKINETTWDDIQNGNGVLINEQFFYTHGLDIGVTIQLDSTLNLNRKVVHQIVGIYSDYGNRLGQIMMNMSSFQKDYSKDTPLNFAVDIHPLSFEMVANMLKNKYGLLESEIINQSTIKEFSTKVFDRTFSITNALSDAMIIIATITLLITLITLSEIRIANLAPLWVLGITRSTLLKFELTQFIMLIILTLSFAIPTGLLICHLLTNYVNVAAFGWKLPFQYYPKIWTQTIFIASLASLFSILFPSIILFKNSPALMIKRYKNDV